jgi:hypothetical protein
LALSTAQLARSQIHEVRREGGGLQGLDDALLTLSPRGVEELRNWLTDYLADLLPRIQGGVGVLKYVLDRSELLAGSISEGPGECFFSPCHRPLPSLV